MSMNWNRENKKFAVIILAILAVGLAVINIGGVIYCNNMRAEFNGFLAKVFGNITEVYPDVPEEELVRILADEGNEAKGKVLLAHYGVLQGYGSLSFPSQERQLLFLRMGANLFFVLLSAVICTVIYLYLKKRQNRIFCLTAYIQALLREGYKLKIKENADD